MLEDFIIIQEKPDFHTGCIMPTYTTNFPGNERKLMIHDIDETLYLFIIRNPDEPEPIYEFYTLLYDETKYGFDEMIDKALKLFMEEDRTPIITPQSAVA